MLFVCSSSINKKETQCKHTEQNGLVRAHCDLEYIRLNSAFCPPCFFKTLFRKALYLQRCRHDLQFFFQKAIVENTLCHSALGPVHFDIPVHTEFR